MSIQGVTHPRIEVDGREGDFDGAEPSLLYTPVDAGASLFIRLKME